MSGFALEAADRAPAKLNLCLYVGAAGVDGLHQICSIFAPLDIADEVSIARAEGGGDVIVCPGVRGRNLAADAVSAFRESFGWDGPSVRITIDKRIPISGGLGGGSADAAATLRLLRGFSGLGPSDGELRELARTLGSDVPSQIEPRTALVTGTGHALEQLEPRPVHAVLLAGPRGLSTPRVYEHFDSLVAEPADLAGLADRLRAAWRAARSPLELVDLLHNDLAQAAMSLEPRMAQGLALLRRAGAAGALPSGSGPTVFGLFGDREEAARARARIAPDWDGQAILAGSSA